MDSETKGGVIAKWHKKTSWGDGYIHYVHYGDGFTVVYMSKFTKLHSLSECCLSYVNVFQLVKNLIYV